MSSEEIRELKAQKQELRMRVDILNKTITVLKKDSGVDLTISEVERRH